MEHNAPKEKAGASATLAAGQREADEQSILPRKVKGRRAAFRLTGEQQRLAASYWPDALAIAGSFGKKYAHLDCDFEGAVALGLCQAAESFRPGGKASFRTYATNRIRGACLDALRAQRIRGFGRNVDYVGAPEIRSIDAPMHDLGRPTSLAQLVPSEDHPVGWEIESIEEVESMTSPLPGRRREVMRLLYLGAETITMKRAGEMLDLSESRISQMHTQSLAMIREAV